MEQATEEDVIDKLDDLSAENPQGPPAEPQDDDFDVVIEQPAEPAEKPAAKQEPEDYSKNVQERIRREQDVTRREREAKEAVERERDEVRRQLDEANEKLRKADSAGEIATLEAQLKQHKAALVEAKNDIDVDKETEAIDGISRVNAEIAAAKRAVAAAPPRAEPPAREEPRKANPPPAEEPAPMSARAKAWLHTNGHWFGAAKYEVQTRMALDINNALLAEGLDGDSDEFYIALNTRLNDAARIPKAEVEKQDPPPAEDPPQVEATPPAAKPAQRSPVAPVKPGAPSQSAPTQRRQVKLTRADLENMERFGLDRDNPEHLKHYAKTIEQNRREQP